MSVAIVVRYRPGHEDRRPDYLPLATEQTYHQRWLPLAERAGLNWLVGFATGTVVALADVPAVLAELATLSELVATQAGLDVEARVELLERIRRAKRLLAGLEPEHVEELFIG